MPRRRSACPKLADSHTPLPLDFYRKDSIFPDIIVLQAKGLLRLAPQMPLETYHILVRAEERHVPAALLTQLTVLLLAMAASKQDSRRNYWQLLALETRRARALHLERRPLAHCSPM